MSTTMRNLRLATPGKPISRRASAPPPTWRRGLIALEHWATARPGVASFMLTVAYLVALLALIGVLEASALNSVIGAAVVLMFAAMAALCVAVGIYTVMPERTST